MRFSFVFTKRWPTWVWVEKTFLYCYNNNTVLVYDAQPHFWQDKKWEIKKKTRSNEHLEFSNSDTVRLFTLMVIRNHIGVWSIIFVAISMKSELSFKTHHKKVAYKRKKNWLYKKIHWIWNSNGMTKKNKKIPSTMGWKTIQSRMVKRYWL